MNAYDVTCPACQSPPGQRCTQPSTYDRRPVNWTHYAREDAAHEKDSN